MRVAAIQYRADRKDPGGSAARLVDLVARAAEDADLVVLPETAASGYLFASVEDARAAAEHPEGGLFPALARVAASTGAWIVGGYVEDDGARLHNSARVIDGRGRLVDSYRKTLLFEEDLPWATPGRGAYRRHDTGVGTFTVGICMDLNDPRFVSWCRRAEVDAIAFPTCWLDEGLDIWPYWAARVAGTGAALVAANTWGRDGHLSFLGRSAVVAEGGAYAGLGPQGNGVVRAEVGRP